MCFVKELTNSIWHMFLTWITCVLTLVSLSCFGLHLVPSSLACHIYFILCSIFLGFFCLSFELHFLIHLAPLMHHYPYSYLIFFPTFLLIHLSICDKKGESILESIPKCIVIYIWLMWENICIYDFEGEILPHAHS